MTIKYKGEAQAWKNGDVALAYGVIEKGFTEYILNSRGEIVAKVEIPVLDGMFKVIASYIPSSGSFQIYSQSDLNHTTTFYTTDQCLAIENCHSREELETFVRGKVDDHLYKMVTEK